MNTALSNEDSLRLQVLLKTAEAVRIDEEALVVHGLASGGREVRVALTPNCRADQYLRRVREFCSGAVLGSPGGYPVHLTRWTRMGQLPDDKLAELLMLGEPEAVAAVSCAVGLTADLARRVWWIAPTSENARRMLACASVARGDIGAVLASHLVEHLPFETEPRDIIEAVRLVLQPGLVGQDARALLWEKGERNAAYRVGFLQALPNALPTIAAPRADLDAHDAALARLAAQAVRAAAMLHRVLDAPGQAFVHACLRLLRNVRHADTAAAALNLIGDYFRALRVGPTTERDATRLMHEAERVLGETGALGREAAALRAAAPSLAGDLVAVCTLSGVSESLIVDILAHTSASGTVLARKLAPVVDAVAAPLAQLARAP